MSLSFIADLLTTRLAALFTLCIILLPLSASATTEPVLLYQPVIIGGHGQIDRDTCKELPSRLLVTSEPSKGEVTITRGTYLVVEGEATKCTGVSVPFYYVTYTRTAPESAGPDDTFTTNWKTSDNNYNVNDTFTARLAPGTKGKQGGACSPCGNNGGGLPSHGNPAFGDPISIGNGNVYEEITDYQSSGSNQLVFSRHYNSRAIPSKSAIALGSNWRTNFDRWLTINSANLVTIERGDGQVLEFKLVSDLWKTDSDVDAKLARSGSTWTLTDNNDNIETYTTYSGGQVLLNTIGARNGYIQTLTYNSQNQLVEVNDSYNRKLNFAYMGKLLQTLTTPDGLVITYGFDVSGTTPSVPDRLASISYSTNPVTKQSYVYEDYTNPFWLTGVKDENGDMYQSWKYDTIGRGLSSTRGLGNSAEVTSISYDDLTNARTVTHPLGVKDTYEFTTLQGVPKTTKVTRETTSTTVSATRHFTYDSNGYIASSTDWNGNLTSYLNNAQGLPVAITDSIRTTTIQYDSTLTHLPKIISEPGLQTNMSYDASGQLLSKTLTDTATGQTRTWSYTWTNGLLSSIKSPRTDVSALTQYSYDANGALIKITNALGQQTTITSHTGSGLPTTVVDPNNVTTTFSYNARQRQLSSAVSTKAGLMTTSFSYYNSGDLSQTTLPDDSAIGFTYDEAHRVVFQTDRLGNSYSYTLNAMGQPTTIDTLANNSVKRSVSTSYDALGRVLQTKGGVGQQTNYTYDANDNALTVGDPLGRTTKQTFDAHNRLVRSVDPLGGVTTYSYDTMGRLLKVTDPLNHTTSYVYNGFGDLIQQISPDTGTTTFKYDSAGNLNQTIDAANFVTNYSYDALDRLKTRTYPANAAENVTFSYDAVSGFGVGRLTSVQDAVGTLVFAYDERGNRVSETRTILGKPLETSYDYDAAGRLASLTYPSDKVVTYVRNIMGQVTDVKLGTTSLVSNINYLPFGPISSFRYGNGVASTRSYDADYRLTALVDRDGASVQNLAFNYDAVNNILQLTDSVTSANTQNFSYDQLDRLISASGGAGLSYTYDAVGNRQSANLGSGTTDYSYDASSNRLAKAGAQTINTDARGNITAFTPALGNLSKLNYSASNRLNSVEASGGAVTRYYYDGFGNRVGKLTSNSATRYNYDPANHLLSESDAYTGAVNVEYVYLDDLPIAYLAGSTVLYLHSDHLGSPQTATAASGERVWTIGSPTGNKIHSFRFPWQYADGESGLYHNGFRDYAPTLGRFVESDPIGLVGGINTYDYVGGNPISRIDPLGLTWSNPALAWNWVSDSSSTNYRTFDLQSGPALTPFEDLYPYSVVLRDPLVLCLESYNYRSRYTSNLLPSLPPPPPLPEPLSLTIKPLVKKALKPLLKKAAGPITDILWPRPAY